MVFCLASLKCLLFLVNASLMCLQVEKDCTRLLWLNLKGLKPLSSALHDVFSLVQKASVLDPSHAESLAKANAQLKKVIHEKPRTQVFWMPIICTQASKVFHPCTNALQTLLAMIMLPSSEPEELGGTNIPLPVQEYVKAVSVCFGSHSMIKDIPSILPAPLQRAEVAVMIEQLEIILQHTSLLLLSSEEERDSVNAGGEALHDNRLATRTALQQRNSSCFK